MSHVKMKCNWHKDPRVTGLSWSARGVWATALSWCSEQLTDGRVSTAAAGFLGLPESDLRELTSAGLMLSDEYGWTMEGYLDGNPSRSQVSSRKAAERARGRTRRAAALREGGE